MWVGFVPHAYGNEVIRTVHYLAMFIIVIGVGYDCVGDDCDRIMNNYYEW